MKYINKLIGGFRSTPGIKPAAARLSLGELVEPGKQLFATGQIGGCSRCVSVYPQALFDFWSCAIAERRGISGDMEVNETKLVNVLHARSLRPAQDEEIIQAGAVPGFASPVGLEGVLVVADNLVPHSSNLVAGANEEGYHLLNVNYGRDYKAAVVADIALAGEGHACPECSGSLRATRGVEVGNIFKLGTRYSDSMGCTFLDRDGKARPVIMGSYGIGVGRLLSCIAEEHHDENGLVWPVTVAPYQIHLIALKGGREAAGDLYASLQRNGYAVLYDDRDETPGVKFKDADLIGIPVRLTFSERTLQKDCMEIKLRKEKKVQLVPLNETLCRVQLAIENLATEIETGIKEVPYRE